MTSTMSSTSAEPENLATKFTSKKAESEIISYCNNIFEDAKRARETFERQWYLNLGFYAGKQWINWTGTMGNSLARLTEPAAPPWRVRMTINRIKPICRAEMAKLTKEKPTGFVIPASSDDDDLAAARAAFNIYEHQARELTLQRTLRRMAFWMVLTGNGYIKDWWDSTYKDGEIHGRTQVSNVSPFHVFVPDLQEEELENQPSITQVRAVDPSFIHQYFGKEVKANVNASADMLEQRFMSAVGITDNKKKYSALKEQWIRPCKKFKDGAVVHWAGDTLLSVSEGFVHEHGEYPFTKFEHIPAGRFYGDSAVNDLIPIQKEFNRTRSQLIEAKNRMAKPQLIAQRGSIDASKVTSEPGLIIQYTPGYQPPTPIPLVSVPSYVVQELDRCLMDMDDIASQHEVSRGQTPPGVEAATAISFLSEQDDTKLAYSIASIEEGVERIGRHILSHANQFWTKPRAIKVLGDNNTYEVHMLSQKDLRQNVDFKVEAGSAMPTSHAAKQAFITELGKMGWIQPNQALRYLGMGETNRMYEEISIDMRQAERENLKLARGEEVPINSWDNDLAHIETHNNFRKKQQFEYLPDQLKEAFEQHVLMHEQRNIQVTTGQNPLPGESMAETLGGPVGDLSGGAPEGSVPGTPNSGEFPQPPQMN